MEVLITNYGPFAFGMVSLLVLWKSIVQPMLVSNNDRVLVHLAHLTRTTEQLVELSGRFDKIIREHGDKPHG